MESESRKSKSIAREVGNLPLVAEKPDSSREIFLCTRPGLCHGSISRYRGEFRATGEIVDTAGKVLGRHDGYEHFTIGQRKGLGIAFGSPRYVVSIDAESHQVVIGGREEISESGMLEADPFWFIDSLPKICCLSKIPYLHLRLHTLADSVEITANQPYDKVHLRHAQYGVAARRQARVLPGKIRLSG